MAMTSAVSAIGLPLLLRMAPVGWVAVGRMSSIQAHDLGPVCRRLCRLEYATLSRVLLEELLLAPNQSFHQCVPCIPHII